MTKDIIQRQTIILMAGLPGSGKTTLATMLGHKLGWELINKDFTKACFMYGGLSDEYAAWNAYEASFRKVAIALREEKRSVILDSSSLPLFVQQHAVALANSSGVDLKVLYCAVENNESLRKKRLFQRNALISQQNERTLTMGNDPDQFAHLWPLVIQKIDTNMPPENCLETALNLCQAHAKAYSICSAPPLFQMRLIDTSPSCNKSLVPVLDLNRPQQQKRLNMVEEASDFPRSRAA